MTSEQLLGYDIRVLWHGPSADWPASRRALYLFKEDVGNPLSTDVMVWPSAFDCRSDCPGRLERRFLQCIWHEDLWADLPVLCAYCNRYFRSAAVGAFVPVTVALTLAVWGAAEQVELSKLQGSVVPPTLEGRWICLGYDVSDRSLLSALTNCAHFTPEESGRATKAQWEPLLNEHHLFRRIVDADAFRLFANNDVPEHSPFFVYGLWATDDLKGAAKASI